MSKGHLSSGGQVLILTFFATWKRRIWVFKQIRGHCTGSSSCSRPEGRSLNRHGSPRLCAIFLISMTKKPRHISHLTSLIIITSHQLKELYQNSALDPRFLPLWATDTFGSAMKCLPSQPLPCSRWQLVVKIFLLQLRQLTITRDSSIRRVGGENHPNLNLEEMTALNSLFIFAEYKKNLLFIEQQKFMPREAFSRPWRWKAAQKYFKVLHPDPDIKYLFRIST